MEFVKHVRKPFIVEAVEITNENIAEIALLVGTLREESGGRPYIHVNRNVVPGVLKVRPGYFMTRMGDNIRCYNRRVFMIQFCENTPEIENWVTYINENESEDDDEPTSVLESETLPVSVDE